MAGAETFQPLWGTNPGVIWSAGPMPPEQFLDVAAEIGHSEGLAAINIAPQMSRRIGADLAGDEARKRTDVPLILEEGVYEVDSLAQVNAFSARAQRGGYQGALIYPYAGLNMAGQLIDGLQRKGVTPIVCPDLGTEDFRDNEGRRMDRRRIGEILILAVDHGVQHFVVPGNAPDRAIELQKQLDMGLGRDNYALAAHRWMNADGKLSTGTNTLGKFGVPIMGWEIHSSLRDMTPEMAVAFYADCVEIARG